MTRNQIEWWNTQEQMRANKAKERETRMNNKRVAAETANHNKAVELETNRANLARESLQAEQNAINFQNYKETARHQKAMEDETNRANLAREAETHSYNSAYMQEWAKQAINQLAETNRANVARETETSRYNRSQEQFATWNANVNQQNADTRSYEADIAQQRQNSYNLSVLMSPETRGYQTAYLEALNALNAQKVTESETNVESRKLHDVLDIVNTGRGLASDVAKTVGNVMRAFSLIQ